MRQEVTGMVTSLKSSTNLNSTVAGLLGFESGVVTSSISLNEPDDLLFVIGVKLPFRKLGLFSIATWGDKVFGSLVGGNLNEWLFPVSISLLVVSGSVMTKLGLLCKMLVFSGSIQRTVVS
jgi:hypothetical protein